MKAFSVLIFFVTFFRVSTVNRNLYVALIFGALGILLVTFKKPRELLSNSAGYLIVILLGFLSLQFLAIDAISGALINNFTNSFFVRILAFLFISVAPALLLNHIYIHGRADRLSAIAAAAFWVQAAFWFATYLIPDFKIALYGFLGTPESVNLRDYNMHSRGFGMSREINYTSPFVMALVTLLFLKSRALTFTTIPTQLINSNMVVVATGIGIAFWKLKLHVKIVIAAAIVGFIVYLGANVFDRLYAELAEGGLRTVKILWGEHIFALNSNSFQHIFGTAEYVFQGGSRRSSDVGWVIMYNYGGALFVLAFAVYLAAASVAALGISSLALAWFGAGVILNTKGLLMGPNSFWFVTVLLSFCRWSNPSLMKSQWGMKRI